MLKLFFFKFSVQFDSNAVGPALLRSRSCFVDGIRGFLIRVKQENVGLQTAELYPNAACAVINDCTRL